MGHLFSILIYVWFRCTVGIYVYVFFTQIIKDLKWI
jgi:hypothetical protein